MKYYKAVLREENGIKVYGNLPKGFVVGYENTETNEVHFSLMDLVEIPEGAEVTEVSTAEYETAIEDINNIVALRKQKELEETLERISNKKERIEGVETIAIDAMTAVAEVYEENILTSEETTNNMVATTEVFEYVLNLESELVKLKNEITILKSNGGA